MAGKYYAVRKGRVTGIYLNWDDCKMQVDGFAGAQFKSFKTAEEAAKYLNETSNQKKVTDAISISNNSAKQKAYAGNDGIKALGSNGFDDIVPIAHEGVLAYVDGSFNKNNGEFSYGMVVLQDGKELKFAGKFYDEELSQMHNVAGEIKGAMAAMSYAKKKGLSKITIFHDYEGIAKWCLGQWKANKKGTQDYKAFFDQMVCDIDIQFVKVTGHSGDKYNEMADRLAKQALGLINKEFDLDVL